MGGLLLALALLCPLLCLAACVPPDQTSDDDTTTFIPLADADGDHFTPDEGDCDDGDAVVHPGAVEQCNGQDDDCDGTLDEGLPNTTWYLDQDGDGYGREEGSLYACAAPAGYIEQGGDCNDTSLAIHPGVSEICDGADQDCNGRIDDGVSEVWYPDLDGDRYGDTSSPLTTCSQPAGFVKSSGDCDDGDADVHPGARESCNDRDDDCDSLVDEGANQAFFRDDDQDGFGITGTRTEACERPAGYAPYGGDCDDTRDTVYPGGLEVCDALDHDCDGRVGEGALYFPDGDGDGFGADDAGVSGCELLEGFSPVRGDCDDGDASRYPGALDLPKDGIDQDCGGDDGQQPCVGVNAACGASIQDALDDARPGQTIWVGPGRYYEHDLTFSGKALRLASTAGPAATLLDGESLGPVMRFVSSEGPDATARGFMVAGGSAPQGGGVYVQRASPTLEDLIVVGNQTPAEADTGGGMYLEDSSSLIRGCSILGNQSYYCGGMYLQTSDVRLEDSAISGNAAASGGGVCIEQGAPTLSDCVVADNLGTGLSLYYADATLTRCTVTGNGAAGLYSGGGIDLDYSNAILSGCRIEYNQAGTRGAGIMMSSSSPVIGDSSISFNFGAGVEGAGLYAKGSSPVLSGCSIRGNSGAVGGGVCVREGALTFLDGWIEANSVTLMGGGIDARASSVVLRNASLEGNLSAGEAAGGYLEGGDLTLTSSRVAGNVAQGVVGGLSVAGGLVATNVVMTGNQAAGGGTLELSGMASQRLGYCAVVGNPGGGVALSGTAAVIETSIMAYNGGFELWNDPALPGAPVVRYNALYGELEGLEEVDSSNLITVPGFLQYEDGQPADLHLDEDSPLVDAGPAEAFDVDGSRADIGCYGGPGGGGFDLDGDGVADWYWPGEWEEAPEGVDPAGWDCDDGDGSVAVCK